MTHSLTRRRFLHTSLGAAGLAMAGAGSWPAFGEEKPRKKLPVAGVVTVYRRNSHADVIIGKILEGWNQDGGLGPDLELVSLYVDQVGKDDMSEPLSKKHGFKITKTIDEAVSLGTNTVPVAGVIIVGEHGKYPEDPKTKQTLYPRRRLFDEVAATYKRCGKVVPTFSDKHLSAYWADAKHMADTIYEMKIPFMAGSSVPVMWREPSASVPMGSEITEAIALGYGGLEHYGFHATEGLQCLIERRKGGETGVKSVQSVSGEGILQAEKDGRWSRALFDAVVKASPTPYNGKQKRPTEMSKDAVFYLIEYKDGTKGTVAMGTGFSHDFTCGVSIRGKDPFVVAYLGEEDRPFRHFEHLLRAIENMIHTGKPSYPFERTLLTTGILDAAMHSLADDHKFLETPWLDVKYTPADWPFAKGVPGPSALK